MRLLCLVTFSTYALADATASAEIQVAKKFLQVSAETQATIKSSRVSYGGNSYNDDTNSPLADFIIGVIMISFAFPILWNNERKQVKIA